MKRLFNDEEARRTVAKLYLPGIEKCLQFLTELKAEFEAAAGEGPILDLDTGQHMRGYTRKGPHWTQTPEGRAKLSRRGKKHAKQLIKARAAHQAKLQQKNQVRPGSHTANVLAVLKKTPLRTADILREANVTNQHSILTKMREKGLITKNGDGLWEAANA